MKITPELEKYYHKKLPIGDDENILGAYNHHYIAYVIPLLILACFLVVVWGLIFSLVTPFAAISNAAMVDPQYKSYVIMGGVLISILALLFTYIPVWMKSQEQLVITDEAVLQILQMSLFNDKVSQLSLQHVADVSVRQGFWGNTFNYGTITIETPGEQRNYEFSFLAEPNEVSRLILETHENFIAALESGRLKTNFRDAQSQPVRGGVDQPATQAPIVIDPAEYQKFLEFQKQQTAQTSPPQTPSWNEGSQNLPPPPSA